MPSPTPTEEPSPDPIPNPTLEPTAESAPQSSPEPTPLISNVLSPSPSPEITVVSEPEIAQTVEDNPASPPPPTSTNENNPNSNNVSELNIASPAGEIDLHAADQNQVNEVTTSTTASETGNNTIQNASEATLNTGDALAIGNLTNLSNVEAVNSSITVVTFNLSPEDAVDLDLNQIWLELQTIKATNDEKALPIFLANHNYISIQNYLNVKASSGENQIFSADTAVLQTGSATAAANLVSVANITLFNSNLMIGIINILPNAIANLILPQPNYFQTADNSVDNPCLSSHPCSPSSDSNLIASNSAKTIASSGQNYQNSPSNSLVTGSSVALLNVFSLLNFTVLYSSSMIFTINNAGGWATEPNPGTTTYLFSNQNNYQLSPPSSLPMEITNDAQVENHVSVIASSGNNFVDGQSNSTITTGHTTAIANILSLINGSFVNSNIFIGVANILGSWLGNIYYAYPDLGVNFDSIQSEVNPGGTASYSITVGNYGYENTPATVTFELPKDTEYQSDTSGVTPSITKNLLTWSLGNFAPNQKMSFTVIIKIADSFEFNNHVSINQSPFIHQVYASDLADRDTAITLAATVIDSSPNLGLAQKKDTATTQVIKSNSNDQSIDNRQVKLELSATNNVHDYVYLGDTVTFDLILKNTSEVAATNTVITQYLRNNRGEIIATAQFNLGTIDPGKGGTLRSGITLKDEGDLTPGNYFTSTIATAHSPNDTTVNSNQADTNFAIHSHQSFLTIPIVNAADSQNTGLVLGTQNNITPEDIFPYFLLVFLAVLWFIAKHGKRINNPKVFSIIQDSASYLLVLAVFGFSVYKIGLYYSLIEQIPFLTHLYSRIVAFVPP